MKRIEIIKNKLHELRSLDKRFSIFGSENHRYQLNKTLTEHEIEQLEIKNHIVFSEEYKEILKHLGNGGAGYGYGLEKLDLHRINPPYIGTTKLLRNCVDPKKMECDMVDLSEISGYVKLFDLGCGMEYCLIVNGEEQKELIFFDCDGRFIKIQNQSLLDIYEDWLDDSLKTLKRIQQKLEEMPLQEVIDSEWGLKNFSVKAMILSIIGAAPIKPPFTGNNQQIHLEKEYLIWKNQKQSKKWWQIWKN